MRLAFVEYQELLLPRARLRVGMAGIVDQGVSQRKRAVGHVVTANVVQPVRQHVEHRLLLRTSDVTLVLAFAETAIVSSAGCAEGTHLNRSRSSLASVSASSIIPRCVRILSMGRA